MRICSNPRGVRSCFERRGVNAQPSRTSPIGNPDRSYKLLREDEDWSFLRDRGLRQDFWDPIKYIPLRREHRRLVSDDRRRGPRSLGADRQRQLGTVSRSGMTIFMKGTCCTSTLHYGKHVRTFVRIQERTESFRIGGPRPIDEKKLDFQLRSWNVGNVGGSELDQVRVGRQELEYGSGRLIDVREGPNVRLSFDGFMMKSKIGSWHVDGFAVRPDMDNPGFFDNAPNSQVGFWGVYAGVPYPTAFLLTRIT